MNQKLKAASLFQRVISATVAILILIGVTLKYSSFGLQILVGAAIVLMVWEYLNLSLLKLGSPPAFVAWFMVTALGFFGSIILNAEPLLMVSSCLAAFLTISIWLTRNRMSNEQLLKAVSLGTLGLFICIVFPGYSIQTLRLPNGTAWFFFHLGIVLSGDIAAYFGGIFMGQEKIMPQISPKKTVAGSISGILGSLICALVIGALFLNHVPLLYIGLVSLPIGFAAQMGDLLLSLVKRVAEVKDSGSIMPGHGGILDRVDGIILTAPLIYGFALAADLGLFSSF